MHDVAAERETSAGAPRSLFASCANPRCAMGWMRLWRSRRWPLFEGQWACSPECMSERVAAAVRREMDRGSVGAHAHRIPVGLMLLDQGWISQEDLRRALGAQRSAAAGGGEPERLGEWLVRSGVLGEEAVAQALGAQWNCPVFSLQGFSPEDVGTALPRLLAEASGAVPVRVAGGKLLYVAFSGAVDRSLAWALEAMTGLRVAAGVARDSEMAEALARYRETPAPRAQLLEASSSWQLARALTARIEARRPAEACLRRVGWHFWLRMWYRGPGAAAAAAIEDVLATVGLGEQNWRNGPGGR